MNYFKHHIGDYASATGHLSWLEDMAYTRLMRLYYRQEAPIPADLAQAARLIRATSKPERDALASVLTEFFTLEEDGWHNARCDAEIDVAKAKANVNQTVGKLGGRPRKTETQTVSENNPNGFRAETQTVSENNPSHKPIANSHKPVTSNQEPEAKKTQDLKPRQSQNLSEDAKNASPARETWDAYRGAYAHRYGVDPVRNAKVNAQIKQLVQRLGATEAPAVAAWYLRHNGHFYVRAKHALDCLIRDCEGLRTEWATGRQVTDQDARLADRKQSTVNAFAPLIAEAEAREKANGL